MRGLACVVLPGLGWLAGDSLEIFIRSGRWTLEELMDVMETFCLVYEQQCTRLTVSRLLLPPPVTHSPLAKNTPAFLW